MAVQRLNHAVLYISDLDRSVRFYTEVMGFTVVNAMGGQAAFLRAPDSTNDHDLGLFAMGAQTPGSAAGLSTVGLYHLAWEVTTLGDLELLQHALAAAGSLVGMSDHGTTKSLYAKDPDGIEFEVVWLLSAHLLTEGMPAVTRPLDLAGEIDRYGRKARSGLGVSVPLGVQV